MVRSFSLRFVFYTMIYHWFQISFSISVQNVIITASPYISINVFKPNDDHGSSPIIITFSATVEIPRDSDILASIKYKSPVLPYSW